MILNALSDATREAMKKMMQARGYEFQSDFARKYYGEGRKEGREEGQLSGGRRAVLTVLEARGLVMDDGQHAQIVGCTDLDQLDSWLRRTSFVSSVAELLAPPVE